MTDRRLRSGIPAVVNALWVQAEGRRVAREFAAAGVRTLVLRGPEVQQRLLGSSASYPSADIDLLVARRDTSRVRSVLMDAGFRFHAGGPLLERLAGHSVYQRSGFVIDVHRRLDVGVLPEPYRSRLERELWRGSSLGEAGVGEARPEPFAVYLAAHAASAGPRSPAHSLARAALALADPIEVDRIAAHAHLRGAVQAAVGAPPQGLVVDGVPDAALRAASAVARGTFVPAPLRDAAREYAGYRRQGFRLTTRRTRPIKVAGHELEWWEGVCGPGTWTDALVESWCGGTAVTDAPILVEVGTGTGALAVLAQERRPAARIVTTDISFRARGNARANMRRLGLAISVHRGDLLMPLPTTLRRRVDAIVAHLPSLWLGAHDDDEGDEQPWAPRETYEGRGADGLDLFRRLLRQAPRWLAPGGRLVLSMQRWQWETLSPEAMAAGFLESGVVAPSPTGSIVSLVRAEPA